MKTPGFPWPDDDELARIATAQAAGFDKAEFAYAIRLLHVWWAWAGQCGPNRDNLAKQDPLYPAKHDWNDWPLKDAVEELLKHHNYVLPPNSGGTEHG